MLSAAPAGLVELTYDKAQRKTVYDCEYVDEFGDMWIFDICEGRHRLIHLMLWGGIKPAGAQRWPLKYIERRVSQLLKKFECPKRVA